jgi:hypothetical protein
MRGKKTSSAHIMDCNVGYQETVPIYLFTYLAVSDETENVNIFNLKVKAFQRVGFYVRTACVYNY